MERLTLDALKLIAQTNRDKRVLLTFHSFGDTDSVSSAVALSKYFGNSIVATPDIITANCGRIMKRLGLDPSRIKSTFDDKADIIFMLDVNNFEDCGSFRYKLEESKKPIVIIDHHSPKEIPNDNVHVMNDEGYNSAASIVYKLLGSLGADIDPVTAKMLLAGIISDSAELKNTTALTFIQIGELLKTAKTEYTQFLEEIAHVAEAEARAKTMEDVRRATMDIRDNMLFVYGSAHAHANLAADAAIKMGADVALFDTDNGKEFSVSARLRSPLDKKYGIHLGQIMKMLAPMIRGSGGGHPCAAGAYGPSGATAGNVTDRFIEEILRRVKGRANSAKV